MISVALSKNNLYDEGTIMNLRLVLIDLLTNDFSLWIAKVKKYTFSSEQASMSSFW